MEDIRESLAYKLSLDLVKIHDGVSMSKLKEGEPLFEDLKRYDYLFGCTIRNWYEVKFTAPLFKLFDLVSLGKDNYGYTDEEYKEEIEQAFTKTNELINR